MHKIKRAAAMIAVSLMFLLLIAAHTGCIADGYYVGVQHPGYYRNPYVGHTYNVLLDAERQAAVEFSCPETRVIRSNYYYQRGIRLNVCGSLVCYEWLGFRGNRNVFQVIPCM